MQGKCRDEDGGAVGSGGGWGIKEWRVMGGEGNRVEENRNIY